jgi:hypothetical protein
MAGIAVPPRHNRPGFIAKHLSGKKGPPGNRDVEMRKSIRYKNEPAPPDFPGAKRCSIDQLARRELLTAGVAAP